MYILHAVIFSLHKPNLTCIAELRKEDLVKHIRKRTIQTGRLFFSSSLNKPTYSIRFPLNLNELPITTISENAIKIAPHIGFR